MYDRICQSVDRNAQEIIAWRRDFHRHAEIAMLEMRTASLVAAVWLPGDTAFLWARACAI